MLKYLIENGSDPQTKNPAGMNCIHVAAQGDQPAVIYFMYKECGVDLFAADFKGSTALHWAAFSGNSTAVEYLLAWGADVNAKDAKGYTPLHLAIKVLEENCTTRTIRLMLRKGADINI